MSSKKLPVSINLFPTLDYVELIQFDDKTGEIEKTASLPCEFDPASRQMTSRDQMAQTIRDLYNMNRIPFNTPAVLVLPSFFSREIELPTEFTKDELRFALISEAERFYIFKKVEPQLDWINLDDSRLLYSAIPRTEIEKYMQIFQELRIPLVAIELSYFSIMRGLVATGAVSEEIDAAQRWCLLVISDTTFFASIQEGFKILKTTDAPLSVTADDDFSAVTEIQQDFESFSETEAFGKLIVVNNSSRISGDALLGKLSFQGHLILIEQNALTLRSRGAAEAQFPCSLEGIGGVFYTQLPELPRMNFLLETGEDVVGIMHYKKQAFNWLLIANAGVFVLSLVLWGLLTLVVWQKDLQKDEVTKQANQISASSDPEKLNDVNRKKFTKKIVDQNVQINNLLVKIGGGVQNDVWLDKITVNADTLDQPLQLNVEGRALNLSQVDDLKNNLNTSLPSKDLEVSNAAQATTQDGQTYFTWTVQNKAATAAAAATQEGAR